MSQPSLINQAQPAIFVEGAAAGMSLEWALSSDPIQAWHALAEIDTQGLVLGIGQPLVDEACANCPGLSGFPHLTGKVSMPSTQHALWAYIACATPGAAFARAEALISALGSNFRLVESTPLFRYRNGHDLTGYADGTANPHDEDAIAAALIMDGALAGGSFALVQRYVHFRARFARLNQRERDNVIGRSEQSDEELEDAPSSSHVKRTDQEGFAQPSDILRHSMPWGDMQRHGLQFVAFMCDLDRGERMLRRMVGLDDGIADALLNYTTAETGAYYYCPPLQDGRLKLPSL